MEQDQKGGGAASDQDVGDTGTGQDSQDSKETVSLEDHNRALTDLHKFKKQNRELTAKMQELAGSVDALKKQGLKEKDDWKTIAESESIKVKELEAKLLKRDEAYSTTQKYSEVKTAAIKAGIRAEAERDLDLLFKSQSEIEDVEIEFTSEGRYIVHGADKFVERQKKLRPHWFKSDTPAKFNSGGGSDKGGSSEFTVDDFIAVEMKHGRNSKEYKEATLKLLESSRKKSASK